MEKFSKLHSYMKYCPNCDTFSRVALLDDNFYCQQCENEWQLETVIDDYEMLLD